MSKLANNLPFLIPPQKIFDFLFLISPWIVPHPDVFWADHFLNSSVWII